YSEHRAEPVDTDLQTGFTAGLAADRHAGRQCRVCHRYADVRQGLYYLGDHGHFVFVVAGADQYGRRGVLDRQGPDECGARAATRLVPHGDPDCVAERAAVYLYRIAPVARRRLDGTDCLGDAGAEPGTWKIH